VYYTIFGFIGQALYRLNILQGDLDKMAVTYSISIPFSTLIPEDVANANPDFLSDQFTCDPFVLNSGTVILVNDAFDTAFTESIHEDTDLYHNIANMLGDFTTKENSLEGIIEFDDEVDPAIFFDLVTSYGGTVTPITA